MKPKVWTWVLAALVWAGSMVPAAGQSGFPWWKDQKVIAALALTPDQSDRIDKVFRAAFSKLRVKWDELEHQEAELSRMIAADATEADVDQQIDTVEAARAGLNKTRTLMLLRMVRVLSPEQRSEFNAVHEQWLRERPRPARGAENRGAGESSPDTRNRGR